MGQTESEHNIKQVLFFYCFCRGIFFIDSLHLTLLPSPQTSLLYVSTPLSVIIEPVQSTSFF